MNTFLKSGFRSILFLTLLMAAGGCLSSSGKLPRSWNELFPGGTSAADSEHAGEEYTKSRVDADFQRLTSLTRELDSVDIDLARLLESIRFADAAYLTEKNNDDAEFLQMRFTHARDALIDLLNYYRSNTAKDPMLQAKGAVLGMSAGLNASYFSSRFVAVLLNNKKAVKLFNAAHPRFEIPADSCQRLTDEVTDIEQIELLHVAWYLFSLQLVDPDSPLARLQTADPVYADLIQKMYRLHADAQLQTAYILHGGHEGLPSLSNRLHHSRIAKLGEKVKSSTAYEEYKGRGFIFKNVARIKKPTAHVVKFSPEQVREIKKLLQPGDIILTFTAGYMSDFFLPGQFKHGITYVGSVEERKDSGLTEAYLSGRAVSEQQRKELLERLNLAKTRDRYDVDVIEAVAEGVVMHSLEQLLATHINRMVVLRPNFTDQERLEQLLAVFQYVGATYDFKFDFTEDTYQCCTEVVYRTTRGKGSIDFSLFREKGRWVLMADDIVDYHLSTPAAFDFVLLALEAPNSNDHQARVVTGEAGEKILKELMEKKK
jgi:hypothetical protein